MKASAAKLDRRPTTLYLAHMKYTPEQIQQIIASITKLRSDWLRTVQARLQKRAESAAKNKKRSEAIDLK